MRFNRNQWKISPAFKKDIKIIGKKDNSAHALVFGKYKVPLKPLFNNEFSSNSIETIRYFAKQVFKNIPIKNLYRLCNFERTDILTYSFDMLPISKEIYFKITNQDDQLIVAFKVSNYDFSLEDIFGHSDELKAYKEDIKKIVDSYHKIINLDVNEIYQSFADYEFIMHTIDAKLRQIITTQVDVFKPRICDNYDAFQKLPLHFNYITHMRDTRKKKSKPKFEKRIKFDDVYGMDDIIGQFKELGSIMKDNNFIEKDGIYVPRGLLLVGPPGTGKTLVTNAFINEFGFNVFTPDRIKYSNKEDDRSIARAFEQARMSIPSVVFIDEIDKIDVSADLFTEMDGQINNDGILVIACANNIQNIPKALLRPGRFDRKIFFKRLSNDTKATILLKSLEKHNTPHNLDFNYLVEFMGNVNGAYIDTYVNEAKIKMATRNLDLLTNDLLIEVIEVVNNGYTILPEISEQVLEHTIVHEAGHAVVALSIYGKEVITKVDVRPNSSSLGSVQFSSKMPSHRFSDILNRVKINLGGIVAERMLLNEPGVGAYSDIASARYMLEDIISRQGLIHTKYSDTLMFNDPGILSTERAKEDVLMVANEIFESCEKDVEKILNQNQYLLQELIEMLKEKPLLLQSDLKQLEAQVHVLDHYKTIDGVSLNKDK